MLKTLVKGDFEALSVAYNL